MQIVASWDRVCGCHANIVDRDADPHQLFDHYAERYAEGMTGSRDSHCAYKQGVGDELIEPAAIVA